MQVRTDDGSFHPHAAAVFKFRFLNRASLNDPFNLLKLSQRASTCIRCGFILGHTPSFGLRAPTASVSTRQDQFSAIKMQEGILLHPVLKTRTSNPQTLNSTEAERFLLKGNDTLRSSETVNQLQENVNVLSRSDELVSALKLSCKYINPARHSCQLLLITLSTPSTSTGHLQLCFCFT